MNLKLIKHYSLYLSWDLFWSKTDTSINNYWGRMKLMGRTFLWQNLGLYCIWILNTIQRSIRLGRNTHCKDISTIFNKLHFLSMRFELRAKYKASVIDIYIYNYLWTSTYLWHFYCPLYEINQTGKRYYKNSTIYNISFLPFSFNR